MVRSFRNSPSVVMWSIGNEIMEQGKKDGWKVAKMLTDIVHDEDITRPVTAGFNNHGGAINNGLADVVDLVGFNYKPALYKETLEAHPDWILYGSETSSCTSTRGVYHLPWEKYDTHDSLNVTSYDFIGPNWAVPPDYEYFHQEDNPEILGEFIWTGFDYLGEPTPYGGRDHSTNGYWIYHWPARSSSFGAVDLCGFPKDRFYLYQSQWTTEPMVHVLPHWNWEGREGESIPVIAYSNCEEVELFVNGKSVGRQKKGEKPVSVPMGYRFLDAKSWDSPYRMSWEVPHKPGSLKVVGYKDGQAVSEKEIKTAGKPVKITLVPDREEITADGYDLSYITVRVEDRKGNLCPLVDNLVNFEVIGAGEIAAVGNGNSATTEPFQADFRKAFNGLAMLIVRSKPEAGQIKVKAWSAGLKGDLVRLEAE
jgi:beta-galactosidase